MDNNHLAGTIFGALSGIYTSVMTSNLMPSKEALIQTAILAAVGGIVGWISVGVGKYLKAFFVKLFSKKK